MALLNRAERNLLRDRLETEMVDDVRIIHFTQGKQLLFATGDDDLYSRDAREAVEDIASLSDRLDLSIYDFSRELKLAEEYGVERVPCTILETEDNRRIRHFGILGGYYQGNLIQAIIDVSRKTGRLSANTRSALQKISADLHLFVLTDEM